MEKYNDSSEMGACGHAIKSSTSSYMYKMQENVWTTGLIKKGFYQLH